MVQLIIMNIVFLFIIFAFDYIGNRTSLKNKKWLNTLVEIIIVCVYIFFKGYIAGKYGLSQTVENVSMVVFIIAVIVLDRIVNKITTQKE